MTDRTYWQEHWSNLTFEELVAQYINDCMQYLSVAKTYKEPDIIKDKFIRTKDQDLIYYGLRKLKSMCMELAGKEPMNWEDSK